MDDTGLFQLSAPSRCPRSLLVNPSTIYYEAGCGRPAVQNSFEAGSQNQSDGICRRLKLTETPDQATGRAFSYPYAEKGFTSFPLPALALSIPQVRFRGPNATMTVAPARRKTGRELSDSLVNRLKRVNSRVAFGTSSVFELIAHDNAPQQ
jgi:hypothetical protein